MAGIGNLVANLTANTSGFTSALTGASGFLRSFASSTNSVMAGVGNAVANAIGAGGKASRNIGSGLGAIASGAGKAASSVIKSFGTAGSSMTASFGKASAASRIATAKAATEAAKVAAIQQKMALAAQKAAERTSNATERTARNTGLAFTSLASFIGTTLGNIASSAISSVVGGLKDIGLSAIQLAANNEQTAISFEVMLGSADAATTMIAQMKKLAADTPLQFSGVQQAGKTLLQFGVAAHNVLPTLKMLGDVSGGDEERFQSLALVFGQMSAAGRLMGQDLLQFVNAGFNPLQEISKRTGESMVSLKKKMEDGGISSDMVAQAFINATSSGGQFFGMMDRQGGTTMGLWNKLKDNIGFAMTEIGQSLINGFNLKGLLADAGNFLDVFRNEWMPGIVSAINTVGSAFQGLVAKLKGEWGSWITSHVKAMSMFISNIDIVVKVAAELFSIWASNSTSRFMTFFQNVGIGLTWLADNWKTVLTDIANLTLVAVKNMGENFGQLFKGIKDWAQGKGFSANFKGLTDGFKSSISEMPKFAEAELKRMSPRMQSLFLEFFKRQQEAAAPKVPGATGDVPAPGQFQLSGAKPASSGNENKAPGLALKDTKEALSNIFAANRVGGKKDEVVVIAKQQLDESRKTNQILDRAIGESRKTGEMVPLPL